jgi:hypothetical protein
MTTWKTHAQCAVAATALLCCIAQAADGANPALTHIKKQFMLTRKEALDWARFKSDGGPTYAGSPSGVRFGNFIIAQAQELGLVDLDYVDIPYQRYVVDDWPDKAAHTYGSGKEVLKLVSDGVGVPVVASYGMTSGFTPQQGITAPMIYMDPASPPSDAAIKGKILVTKTIGYPAAVPGINGPYAYTSSVLSSYVETDYLARSEGRWLEPYIPIPASLSSSQWGRFTWSQVNALATRAIRAGAAGMVVVYDLSPAMALGLTQRTVYAASGTGANVVYANVPTLTLDRVNGAKVLDDARAGKSATLTLLASFQLSHGKEIIGYLPGKDYGTASDRQILIATHQDAMSLIEDDGSLGMLAILKYFSHIPQQDRPRTIVFYFDNRHFMPGAESAWSQYDYYSIHPEKIAPLIAAIGMEHMGGKATIETGPDGNDYVYQPGSNRDGAIITGYIDLDPNEWMIKQIRNAIKDNGWERAEAKSNALPGVNGGYQSPVRSPLNKGSQFGIAGLGLAGDWPGAWTQTYAQLQTEAEGEVIGFDADNFLQEVAGFSQMVGNLMLVDPVVIDPGWGGIRAGLQCEIAAICSTPPTGYLPDSQFVSPAGAPSARHVLLDDYFAVTDLLEKGHYDKAKKALANLQDDITRLVAEPNRTALNLLVSTQAAKLP